MEQLDAFYNVLFLIGLVGLVVFVVLYFIDAGYGKMINDKWGPTIPNKVGWVLMECPVFLVMLYFWGKSDVLLDLPYLLFFLFFQIHYFQRSFVFPLLLKGKSRMPVAIMVMSIIFNLVNGYVQGTWLFELAPALGLYNASWLTDPRFIIGAVVFFTGMAINWHSDYIIRHLRKPGDTKHYLPKGGMYNYVTSANYFGEILEWLGWAILTWSWAGLSFFWFTCANLVPRSNAIYHKYEKEFSDEFHTRNLKRIFPFIY